MTGNELKDRIMSGISESLMSALGGNSLNELKSETLNRAANKAAHFGDNDRAERFRNYAKEVKDREESKQPKPSTPAVETYKIYDLGVITFDNGDELHVIRYAWNSKFDEFWNKTKVGMIGDICNRMCLAYITKSDEYNVDVFMIEDNDNTLCVCDVYDDEQWHIKSFFGQHGTIEDGNTNLRKFCRKDAEEIARFINMYVPATSHGDKVSYREFYDKDMTDKVKMTMRQVRTQKKVHYIQDCDPWGCSAGNVDFFFVDENDDWKFTRHVICKVYGNVYMAMIDNSGEEPVLVNETEEDLVLKNAMQIHGSRLRDNIDNVITDAADMMNMLMCVLTADQLTELDDRYAMRGHGNDYTLREVMSNTSEDFDRYTYDDAWKNSSCRYIDLKKKEDVLGKVMPEMERFLPGIYFETKRKFEEADRKAAGDVAAAWDALQKALKDMGADTEMIRKVGGAYTVDLFGKRGIYDESGKREYVRESPWMCKRIMERIGKIGNGQRITGVKISTFDDVPDLGYSRSMQTECYGQRTKQVTVSLSDGRNICIF